MCCIVCNNPLKKNASKYCSIKCQNTEKYRQFIEKWLNNEIEGTITNKPKPSKFIYRYFRETITNCELCGIRDWNNKEITLEIDHIDGNRTNNTRENLRYICPNCHSQTSTFRNKKREDT